MLIARRRLRRPGRGRGDPRARAPCVDIVVGPQTYHRLPELLARARAAGGAVLETDFPVEDKFDHLPERAAARAAASRAFLTVQEGCDKFCTFCVVPYTRGAEVSRPVARRSWPRRGGWSRAGAREITLLGQNVNAYHGDGPDGGALGPRPAARARWPRSPALRGCATRPSHPRDMDDDADRGASRPAEADAVPAPAGAVGLRPHARGDEPRPHGRRLSPRWSSACARRGRTSRCRRDFIVGFPGESDADFEATLALVRESASPRPSRSNIQPRPGTPAAAARPGAGGGEGRAAAAAAGAARDQQARVQPRHASAATLPVLFERPGRHPGQLVGRTPYCRPCIVAGDRDAVGEMVDVADRRCRTQQPLGRARWRAGR